MLCYISTNQLPSTKAIGILVEIKGFVPDNIVSVLLSTNKQKQFHEEKYDSCIDIYSHSCLRPLSNERKSMFKSGDSRAV